MKIDRSNEKRKRECRKILPGFPWFGKFKTKLEVDTYLSGDKIQCLLCGKMYRSLGHHVFKIHNIDSDAYKERYGLPYDRGLASGEYHNRHRKTQQDLYVEGVNPLSNKATRLKGSQKARKKNVSEKYRVQPFNKDRMSRTHLFSSASTHTQPKSHIEWVINKARDTGKTLSEILNRKDCPITKSTFYKWRQYYKEAHGVNG